MVFWETLSTWKEVNTGEDPQEDTHKIETILKNLQERLNAHDNRIIREGVRMGEFAYISFGNLKDGILKGIPQGGFELFVDALSLCSFCNMDYTS